MHAHTLSSRGTVVPPLYVAGWEGRTSEISHNRREAGGWMSRSAYRYEHDLASLLQLPLQELLHARDVVFERRRWRLCREVLVRRKGFTCGGLAIGLGGCGHGWYKRGGKGYLEGALAAQNSPQSGFGGDPGLRGSMGGDE